MAILLLHGGAGRIAPERQAAYRAGLDAALTAGTAVLARGGSALDAVCAAVASMEDDPYAFNAGTGSALTLGGTVECDACVMEGGPEADAASRAGAVACVTTSRNPVASARRVLEDTPHVLLVGAGAEALEPDPIDPATLITGHARASLERWRRRRDATPQGSATCGAVAIADDGRLAAATSTGGVIGQLPGRVGDTPIPGAGTWADGRIAISCTGRGEAFLTAASARALASDLTCGPPLATRDDAELAAALTARLAEVRRHGGSGGLIAVTRDHRLLFGFDTPHLAVAWRARARDGGPWHGESRIAATAGDGADAPPPWVQVLRPEARPL